MSGDENQARDRALRELYEAFPYPLAVADLGGFLDGSLEPVWSPKTSFPTFYPEEEPREDLDILIAGCGTNAAPIMAATMPHARVVGIDISTASLEISAASAKKGGLKNLELVQLAIEDVESLGRDFDFVLCEGVLHHLADPVLGLDMLGKVTRPQGAILVMVYAQYGRTGLYMLQDLCRQLGLGVDESSAKQAQALLAALPASHPFRLIHPAGGALITLEEVADMLLNPRDIAYRVPDVRAFVEASGLRFHRWLGNAEYRPEFSALAKAGLLEGTRNMDPWEAAAAAELSHGNLCQHKFVVTHPGRKTAAELFQGEALGRAVPSLAAQLKVEDAGINVALTNGAHQVPVRVIAPKAELVPKLRAIDGKRALAELDVDLEFFRNLYHADVIQLSLPQR